jgi:formylglycine-generating enzyme required for sulfatase activity
VTNSKYKKYLKTTDAKAPANWNKGAISKGKEEHPVTYVTWQEARSYCVWEGRRLPSEQEWERAARGDNGNKYSWGNEYDETKANLNSGEVKAVGSYVDDRSPHGVYDMAGNVMEWVDDWYDAYPGSTSTNKDYGGDKHKVLRGGMGGMSGHYIINKIYARGANRNYYIPGGAGDDGGFRCAKGTGSGGK